MGFMQTDTHRYGKGSYHQIGLVRGQFGSVPMDRWVKFVQETGFDGWEEASWEMDLARCDTDAGAEAYAKERVDLAKKHGLEIFNVATHLQSQALGDTPSARTLKFVGGDAAKAYKEWRDSGKQPPPTDPYYVPDEVGKLIHKQAEQSLIRCARLAHYLGKLQNRRVAIPGFVGSPAGCWNHKFRFPRLSDSIAGHGMPDVRHVSLELLIERFAAMFDACKKYGVTYDLECHPSERAMGDIAAAGDYITHMCKAGYDGVVGFNLDGSHMEWQGVTVVQFIRELGQYIHCAHVKGVQTSRKQTRASFLGGHGSIGHPLNSWNFDANSVEQVMIELNRVGYDGAVAIEFSDASHVAPIPGQRITTLTAMFIDMARSAEYAQRHGSQAAFDKRQTYHRLLLPWIPIHGGTLIQTIGDGLLVIFDEAADAAACAIVLQRRLASYNATEPEMADQEIHIRIGIHTGKAIVFSEGDRLEVVGRAVDTAARVEEADRKRSDQILLSEEALMQLGRDFATEPLRTVRAKGIGSLRIHRLAWKGCGD